MKLKFALVGLVALGGAALSAEAASAMPLAPLAHSQASNVEDVALVWFAARMGASARPPSIVTAATESVEAMGTDIMADTAALMGITAATAVTNFKRASALFFCLATRIARRHSFPMYPQWRT